MVVVMCRSDTATNPTIFMKPGTNTQNKSVPGSTENGVDPKHLKREGCKYARASRADRTWSMCVRAPVTMHATHIHYVINVQSKRLNSINSTGRWPPQHLDGGA